MEFHPVAYIFEAQRCKIYARESVVHYVRVPLWLKMYR